MSSTFSEQVFRRFDMLFGAQKMASVWAENEPGEVRKVWDDQLARFTPATIARATQSVIDDGLSWPPTLPEFVARCRSFIEPAHSVLKLPEPPRASIDTAQRMIERARRQLAAVRTQDDPLLAEPITDDIRGRILAIYRDEARRGAKPNKRWACKLLLRFLAGEPMRPQQFEMSCRALKFDKPEADQLADQRRHARSAKVVAIRTAP